MEKSISTEWMPSDMVLSAQGGDDISFGIRSVVDDAWSKPGFKKLANDADNETQQVAFDSKSKVDGIKSERAPEIDAQPKALPDTPIDQPRRQPDHVSPHDGAKFETWKYPDGTSERRYTARGGYCSLTRYDEQGKMTDEFTVNGSQLTISRADGSVSITYNTPYYRPYKAIYGNDGSYRTEDVTRKQANDAFSLYRKIIMR